MIQRKGRNYFMNKHHESMEPGWDQTGNPWICSQTRICCQTRYRQHFAAHFFPLSLYCGYSREPSLGDALHLSQQVFSHVVTFSWVELGYSILLTSQMRLQPATTVDLKLSTEPLHSSQTCMSMMTEITMVIKHLSEVRDFLGVLRGRNSAHFPIEFR